MPFLNQQNGENDHRNDSMINLHESNVAKLGFELAIPGSAVRLPTDFGHPCIEQVVIFITKTCLFKYIENFTSKNRNFSDKKLIFFHISAQNIDCGYSLEPPRRGGSNEYPQSMFLSRNKKIIYTPVKPSFTI